MSKILNLSDPTVLQRLLLPGLTFKAPKHLYVRPRNDIRVGLQDRSLDFKAGGRASFDTYFNGITVATWKRICGIEQVSLRLAGSGRFSLRLGLHRLGGARQWLLETELTLITGDSAEVNLPFWPDLDLGMLYVSLEALTDGVLTDGAFTTRQKPASIKLGVVITHFNRKTALLPTIERLKRELLDDPGWHEKIDVVIVDNSKTVMAFEAPGATVLPNPNFGGSGGFARGLLHLKDNGFSHCLFMDDDASCETESIKRAFVVLAFATKPQMAVCGAQLRETAPWLLHEVGASFRDGAWLPRKHGLDIGRVYDLLIAEREDAAANYGGWWFFGFDITIAKHFPYPFFVRGDDVQFSLQNPFQLTTLNGICSMAEDFWIKENPMIRYLASRATIVLMLLNSKRGVIAYWRWLALWFVGSVYSYNYASGAALNLALEHALLGPEFFIRNLDISEIRTEISSLASIEKMSKVDITDLEFLPHVGHERRSRRWLRHLSLHGFLLPGIFIRNETRLQLKQYTARFPDVFRYRRIAYYSDIDGNGYIATHDKARFFSECVRFARNLVRLGLKFGRLRAAYRNKLPAMTSEAFWRDVYDLPVAKASDTATRFGTNRNEATFECDHASQGGVTL